MSGYRITDRERAILQILLEMQGGSVTASDISEKLEVSSRTVSRELPGVENWLKENGAKLSKKRGRGISVEADPDKIEELKDLLSEENILPLYSKRERRKSILGRLFLETEPVKSYVFTSDYGISEGTLFSDLEVLERWLKDTDIRLVRRAGMGIFLEGEEVDLRQALCSAVMEFSDINDIPAILSAMETSKISDEPDNLSEDPLLSFFEKEIAEFALDEMLSMEEEKGIRYVDSSRISLILRISIAIYRMRQGCLVTDVPIDVEKISELSDYPNACRIADDISAEFGIEVSDTETAYLALHLAATRIWSDAGAAGDPLQSINIRQIVTSMTAIAEQLTHIPFQTDNVLMGDLTNHIRAMKRNIPLDNVFAENRETLQLRRNYPEIYEAAETASQVLKEWIYPKELKRTEVALVAIHLMASAERIQKNTEKISVVIVCPVGIASSKMLAATLERAYPELEIRELMSAFDIDEERLRENGIDLIISTTEIKTDFPYIRVSHILQRQERLLIQSKIDELNRMRIQSRIQNNRDRKNRRMNMSLKDIRYISEVGREISELYGNFRIISAGDVSDHEGLIREAGEIFGGSLRDAELISRGLAEREAMADTYLPEMNIYLLHCITPAVEHVRAAFLRLPVPVTGDKGSVEGAMLMLIPEGGQKYYLEIVGRISTLLVDDPGFLAACKADDNRVCLELIEDAMVSYYQEKLLIFNGK